MLIAISLVIIVAVGFFAFQKFQSASLAETVILEGQHEDFVVHIQIEPDQDGVRVLRSLQYIGDEDITIEHRSPLTQITINTDNAVFTGSTIKKHLQQGSQYYTQEPLRIPALNKGTHVIYVHTQFKKDGEQIDIKSKGEVRFE